MEGIEVEKVNNTMCKTFKKERIKALEWVLSECKVGDSKTVMLINLEIESLRK